MVKIFVSYRHIDTQDFVLRLKEKLSSVLGSGRIWVDVEGVAAGGNFRDAIRVAVKKATVVLVVIGDRWAPERLEEDDDMVRAEIELALKFERPILPVLVNCAEMPKAPLPKSIEPFAGICPIRMNSERFNDGASDIITWIRKIAVSMVGGSSWVLAALAVFVATILWDSVPGTQACLESFLNVPPTQRLALQLAGGLAATLFGGVLWRFVCLRFHLVFRHGGSGIEPRGGYAFLWGIVNLLPMSFCVAALSGSFDLLLFMRYALASGIAANLFYDSGLRAAVESHGWDYSFQELIIIVLWSFIMAFVTSWSFSTRLGLSHSLFVPVVLTVVACAAGLFAYLVLRGILRQVSSFPQSADDEFRGLVAGFSLRAGLFAGALTGLNCVDR